MKTEACEHQMTYHGTISLRGLIELLEARPKDQTVRFDFGGFAPKGIDSYRGYYDHLAIGYAEPEPPWEDPKVGSVLAMLREANGKTYEGYKGGDFRMDLDTPVWVANWSHSPGTTIIGVTGDYDTVILTGYAD
jgi:hypothetical protein